MDDNERELHALVGRRLRLARRIAGLSQQQVADAAGVSRSSVALIELGKNGGVDVYRLRRVAAAAATSLVELFDGRL